MKNNTSFLKVAIFINVLSIINFLVSFLVYKINVSIIGMMISFISLIGMVIFYIKTKDKEK